jgi:hypothetical protein
MNLKKGTHVWIDVKPGDNWSWPQVSGKGFGVLAEDTFHLSRANGTPVEHQNATLVEPIVMNNGSKWFHFPEASVHLVDKPGPNYDLNRYLNEAKMLLAEAKNIIEQANKVVERVFEDLNK